MLRILRIAPNKPSIIFVLGLFFTSIIQAQPLVQRKTWNGPFQIKMTASANLQPVYLNTAQATAGGTTSGFLLADSVIKDAGLQRTGSLQDMNNRFKNGGPGSIFEQHAIPKSSFLCKGDPNAAGCLNGLLISNTTTTTCVNNTKYNGPDNVNMYVSMTYPDYDTDMSTFSSSMGRLDVPSCAEIETAYLYWTGTFSLSNKPITLVPGPLNTYDPTIGGVANSAVFTVPNTTGVGGFDAVKFKVPGGTYQNVTAATRYNDGVRYVCVADVTTLVSGVSAGPFWVGNLRSYPIESNGGSSSGWTLVVVYKSPLSPPTLISLWDGMVDVSSSPVSFNLNGFTAPASGTFDSYIGLAALDAEDVANELATAGKSPSALGFDGGNGNISINQMMDQPVTKIYNKKGYPAQCDASDNIDGCKMPLYDGSWCSMYDGALSSQITSYNQTNGLNGNQVTRLPQLKNTLGYDSHHIKLPSGSVAYGSNSATFTVNPTNNGSMSLFMTYIAIEQLQPKLTLDKTADINYTNVSNASNQIKYTIRVKNQGNAASLGGDFILDSLDEATNFVPGSFSAKRYTNGVPSDVTGTDVTLSIPTNDTLQFMLVSPIPAKDSIDITFSVSVIDLITNPTLYSPPSCKRTIENIAHIKYNTVASGVLYSKSNSNECGIGPETKVLIIDSALAAFGTQISVGPVAACSFVGQSIVDKVQEALINAGYATSATINDFDIRYSNASRIPSTDLVPTFSGNLSYYAYHDVNTAGPCQEIYTVTFNCTPPCPKAEITGSASICDGLTTPLTVTLSTGTAPWTYVYAIDSVNQPMVTVPASSLGVVTFPSAIGAHTYTLISVGDANYPSPGCGTVTGSPAVVTLKPTPTVTSPLADTVCSGSSVNYTIVSNVATTYTWSRAAVGSSSAKTNQSSNPITESFNNTTTAPFVAQYIITPASVGGCAGIVDTVNITVFPRATVSSVSSNPGICSGTAQNYDITSAVGTATFVWDRTANSNINGNVGATAQTADPITEVLTSTSTSQTSVTYKITPMVGTCPGTVFTYTVKVNPVPVINSTATGTICSGVAQNYLIKSNVSGTTYSWDRAAVANISNAAVAGQISTSITEALINTTTSAVGPVSYVITPTAGGCTGSAFTYDVTVNPQTIITTTPVGVNLCSGDPLTLSVASTGLTPTYQWRLNGVNIPGATNANYTVSSVALANGGQYTVKLNNACPDSTSSVSVNVTSAPSPSPTVSALSICKGQSSTVTIANSENGVKYQAFISPGTTPVSTIINGTGANISFNIDSIALPVGSHTVIIKAYGCDTITLTSQPNVQVSAIPHAVAGKDTILDNYAVITLDGSGSSLGTYLWTSSDPLSIISNPTAVAPTVDFKSTVSVFTLTVSDLANPTCNDTARITVRVEGKPVVIPNAFSPNGDGVHDVFIIQNVELFPKATLYIYNQWGELIFKSSPGYSTPWDGKRNGKDVPISAYYYIFETNESGYKSLSGTITLLK